MHCWHPCLMSGRCDHEWQARRRERAACLAAQLLQAASRSGNVRGMTAGCRARRPEDAAWLAAQLLQAGLGGMRAELAKQQPWIDPGTTALPDLSRLADLADTPHPGSGSGPGGPPVAVPAQAGALQLGSGSRPGGPIAPMPAQASQPEHEPAVVAPWELNEEPRAIKREPQVLWRSPESGAASYHPGQTARHSVPPAEALP